MREILDDKRNQINNIKMFQNPFDENNCLQVIL